MSLEIYWTVTPLVLLGLSGLGWLGLWITSRGQRSTLAVLRGWLTGRIL